MDAGLLPAETLISRHGIEQVAYETVRSGWTPPRIPQPVQHLAGSTIGLRNRTIAVYPATTSRKGVASTTPQPGLGDDTDGLVHMLTRIREVWDTASMPMLETGGDRC